METLRAIAPTAALPGAVGVTHLRVYDTPAPDGVPGGSPHVHFACTEAYVTVGGRGAVQTLCADGFREVFRNASEDGGSWDDFEAALDDDFNTPQALAVMHEWRDHDHLLRALNLFGLASLAEEKRAPAELEELARQRADARSGGAFDEADRLRERIEAAGWEVRDVAGDSGYRLVPKR